MTFSLGAAGAFLGAIVNAGGGGIWREEEEEILEWKVKIDGKKLGVCPRRNSTPLIGREPRASEMSA